jgi:hypothetical protein
VDADQWDERYRATPALWGGLNVILEPLLSELSPGRAVDLACGDGRHAAWLAGRGWQAHGVDFSTEAIAQALRRDTGAPVLHLPADERAALTRRALTWLAPRGRLVMLAHALENLTYGVGGPQDAAILPRIEELAVELSGARVHRLQHVGRWADGREAIDVLVDVSPWSHDD